jgi:hypothetical protein
VSTEDGHEPTAEERAEAMVDDAAEAVSRFARRLVARVREEAEDMWAEARAISGR